jgi:hypothetical protein
MEIIMVQVVGADCVGLGRDDRNIFDRNIDDGQYLTTRIRAALLVVEQDGLGGHFHLGIPD